MNLRAKIIAVASITLISLIIMFSFAAKQVFSEIDDQEFEEYAGFILHSFAFQRNAAELTKTLASLSRGELRIVYLLVTTPDNTIISASVGQGVDFASLNEETAVEEKLTPTGAVITTFETNAGQLHEYTARSPNTDEIVRIGIKKTHPTGIFEQAFTKILAILITVSALALAVILGFSARMTKPMKKLYAAVHELSLGNFKTHVTIKTGDELEELGLIFNRTAEALGKIDEERKQIDQAKTRFLSITSHELRSPMTPMKAQLQMLDDGYFGKLNEKQRESISMVIRNADRLDKLIADFLEISRIEAARLKFIFRKTDVAKTIKEVVEYMKGYMPEKGILFSVKIGRLPTIQSDPDRISQVLRNLLSNAIKFSKQNGTITITANQKEDAIIFSVKDEGIGITPKDQLKLFEPFFQAEQTIYREGKGVGLGLAISRGIILSQNGKIWLESQVGKGTTIHFTFPLTPVEDVKPIRILFSSKETIERKLALLFKEILGPIGTSEFGDLCEHELTRDKILSYVDELIKKRIIDHSLAEAFKHKIRHAFAETDHHSHHQEVEEDKYLGK